MTGVMEEVVRFICTGRTRIEDMGLGVVRVNFQGREHVASYIGAIIRCAIRCPPKKGTLELPPQLAAARGEGCCGDVKLTARVLLLSVVGPFHRKRKGG